MSECSKHEFRQYFESKCCGNNYYLEEDGFYCIHCCKRVDEDGE